MTDYMDAPFLNDQDRIAWEKRMQEPLVMQGRNGMTFTLLRTANMQRLPLFKNARGEAAHSEPDGSDWSLSEWACAALGELGEAANMIKKVNRGDFRLEEARYEILDEIADTIIYLDILAMQVSKEDLGMHIASKWNRTSTKVGVPLSITVSEE